MAQSQIAQTFTSKKTMFMKIDLNSSNSPFLKANYPVAQAPTVIGSEIQTGPASANASQMLSTIQRPQSVNVTKGRIIKGRVIRKINSGSFTPDQSAFNRKASAAT